jgi:HEAT repeat protein
LPQFTDLSAPELVALLGAADAAVQSLVYQHLLDQGQFVLKAVLVGLTAENARIREGCAKLLDHLGDEDCIEPLLQATHDVVASVRQAAVHSLICDRCKTEPLSIDLTPRLVELALYDPSVKVRTHAVIGLKARQAAAKSDPTLIPLLTKLALTDPSAKVRIQAVGSLGFYAPDARLVPAMEQVIGELTAKPNLSKRERSLLSVARWTCRHHQRQGSD